MKKIIPFILKELEPKSFHPIVEVIIEEELIYFIIDTGASRTVIDKTLTASYKSIIIEDEEPYAAGINAEKILVEQVELPSIKIGDIDFQKLTVFSADLSAISNLYEEMAGIKISGLLGCDFLAANNVTMDFMAQNIIINTKG